MLLPFYLLELNVSTNHTSWSTELLGSILYLGIGTSVLAFWCWNLAIAKLGAGKTVLFGNLIPVFSTLEAVFFIGEKNDPDSFGQWRYRYCRTDHRKPQPS